MKKIKPFGVKAYNFAYRHPSLDKSITILEGSIRSSKTFSFHPKIILGLCRYQVGGLKVIVGVSKNTVKDNLLRDLFEIIGEENYHYNNSTGDLKIFGTNWIVIGAKDEGSEKYLRGKTIGVAVVEEGVLIPKSFLLQLLGRLSPKGSRCYINTNPDSPYHYMKTEIIDNPALKNDLEVIHFDLDDNPNLDPGTRARYERMYTGVFYQRMIQGLWVVAEGAIYRDSWSEDLLYDDSNRPAGLYGRGGWSDHIIAVDYGTINPCVFLDIIDDGTRAWLDREYYWDSRARGRDGEIRQIAQKTDQQYADDLEKFIAESRVHDAGPRVIVDPSAASFKIELVKRGIWVVDANNEVIDGIRRVSSAMALKYLRVHKDCTNFQREVVTYAWNSKKADKGDEDVIKQNDHAMDAVRYGVNDIFKDYRLVAD